MIRICVVLGTRQNSPTLIPNGQPPGFVTIQT